MKKILVSIASALLATSLCCTITACGGNDGLGEDMVSDVVTTEEWSAALSKEVFDNFKIDGEVIITTTNGTIQSKSIYTVEGEKTYLNTVMTSGKASQTFEYYSDNNGKYCNENGAGWERKNGVSSSSMYIIDYSILIEAQDYFSDFEYNENSGGYLLKADAELADIGNTGGFKLSNLLLKFIDGNLAFASMKRDVTISSYPYKSMEYNFMFTFGGQMIDTPLITE